MARTLRDEFAMAALTGLVAGEIALPTECKPDAHKDWAKGAYKIANAMMKERLKHSTAKERGVFSSD
jgi:hypothetical protein